MVAPVVGDVLREQKCEVDDGEENSSEGKATWPGPKQVYRKYRDGIMTGDVVTLEGDTLTGDALLEPMMLRGSRLEPRLDAVDVRRRVTSNLSTLPEELQSLNPATAYPVKISRELRQLAANLDGPTSGEPKPAYSLKATT